MLGVRGGYPVGVGVLAGPNWKVKPWRSPKFGIFVRGLPCALTGDEATEYLAIDPHHEEIPGNSGMSTKASDERQIPIRHDLHVRMESGNNSRASVYEEFGKDPEELILQTQEAWFRKYGSRPWIKKGVTSERNQD